MGISNIGWSGLILILIVLLLIFGPSKLPEIGRSFGKSLKEFKHATRDMMEEATQSTHDDASKSTHVLQASDASQLIEPIVIKESTQSTNTDAKPQD